jgi:hypothetical protein
MTYIRQFPATPDNRRIAAVLAATVQGLEIIQTDQGIFIGSDRPVEYTLACEVMLDDWQVTP